jgi:hypothetical protein
MGISRPSEQFRRHPQFTHHNFRHFFATICIESGVDLPTASRWLGHKDGGAPTLRVYGHLRQEHSFAAIKQVPVPGPLAPFMSVLSLEEKRGSPDSGLVGRLQQPVDDVQQILRLKRLEQKRVRQRLDLRDSVAAV